MFFILEICSMNHSSPLLSQNSNDFSKIVGRINSSVETIGLSKEFRTDLICTRHLFINNIITTMKI